jgi:hypothetical protein
MSNEIRPWRLRDPLTAVALFLATAAFTLWQNTRVAVLWDISFLLDTAYRFTLHQLPYKTLPFPYAPLTFLLHAALIKIFGRIYFPHILCAALEGATATLLTWRILLNQNDVILAEPESLYRSLPNRRWLIATALAAPLTLLGIYGIYPHPIYDSDCTFTILLALYLLQRAAASPLRNFVAGAICVLPLFVKQNIGLPFLLVTLAAIATIAITRRLQRASIPPQLWLFAGAITTLAAAFFLIQTTVGLHNYLYWTITFAAQRRLPGLSVLLTTYRQTTLLWSIPAAIAALILLHRSQSHRVTSAMRHRSIAILLLAAPFLWTIASLALATDPSDRADQFLSLWPHLLILSAALAVYNLFRAPTLNTLFPLILLATIHGAFLSQQLWGSTYAIWPLLTLLIAMLLTQVPTIARPLAAIIAATFLVCGGLYTLSHERLSYIHLDGPEAHATLPPLRDLATPGPWIPDFEELVRVTNTEIPANDAILILPGEDPFYFTTGRTPQFPILLFDPATDPYTPQQTLEQARAHNIQWLIIPRTLQLNSAPHPDLPEIIRTLQPDFTLYRTLANYDIYRRKQAPL